MSGLSYAVLGQGPWGRRIPSILEAMPRRVSIIRLSRPRNDESLAAYRPRAGAAFKEDAAKADVIWLAIPPGQQGLLADCALELDKHVIAEKPWLIDAMESAALEKTAARRKRAIGLHYEYCYLDGLVSLKEGIEMARSTTFSGAFVSAKEDRLKLPAMANLGSHLLAIRRFHFPQTALGAIKTGFGAAAERWIELTNGEKTKRLDFLDSSEPLIQRFISAFEECVENGTVFPMGPSFGSAVEEEGNRAAVSATTSRKAP